jgi:hypothetical protein
MVLAGARNAEWLVDVRNAAELFLECARNAAEWFWQLPGNASVWFWCMSGMQQNGSVQCQEHSWMVMTDARNRAK